MQQATGTAPLPGPVCSRKHSGAVHTCPTENRVAAEAAHQFSTAIRNPQTWENAAAPPVSRQKIPESGEIRTKRQIPYIPDQALLKFAHTPLCRREGAIGRCNRQVIATAADPAIETSDLSICEPEGLSLALDRDLIFSCFDRPWPRAVLNSLAYTDLIPVIDGGIAIDTRADGSMCNAVWRTHVIRPGRPCMACNRQLELGDVPIDRQRLLEDPHYIAGSGLAGTVSGENVATLSASVSAGLLALYTSFSAAPASRGDPRPLRYSLNTHDLKHLDYQTRPHCPVEAAEAAGDRRPALTDRHPRAELQRRLTASPRLGIRLLRSVDDRMQAIAARIGRR